MSGQYRACSRPRMASDQAISVHPCYNYTSHAARRVLAHQLGFCTLHSLVHNGKHAFPGDLRQLLPHGPALSSKLSVLLKEALPGRLAHSPQCSHHHLASTPAS